MKGDIFNETMNEPGARQEVRNERVLLVYNRAQCKLTGTCGRMPMSLQLAIVNQGQDFDPDNVLTVPEQVDKLILQATSVENLCQCFSGWYVTSYSFLVLYRFTNHRLGVISGSSLIFAVPAIPAITHLCRVSCYSI